MSIQHHLYTLARKYCHCQGRPIIQQCRNNVDFHLSCGAAQATVITGAVEKDWASFQGDQLRDFHLNIKEIEQRTTEGKTCKLSFEIEIKSAFLMEMEDS